ncbi:ABC transporter substrate-binding protein [uncultured Acetatifactor sp.]|uniref:ABC transporter substrate-binding protein n=1 Tax=uncultured Acetatifactor sp. TaxID=1671927 RepID=UPI00261935AC|nr:MqnA/MqnD/SBP family protein [uncultured Acetatifactor sp.]
MRKYKCKYTKKHARERGLPLYALIAVMLFSVLPLSGCGREAGPESVRIGSLKGPTSLGILDLMDRAEKGETKHPYEFRMAVGADELLPLMAKGELDMALIPANVAAVLYHKTEGGVCVVDINTLGVLYLVTGDEAVAGPADLKGRTICLTGKGATPEASLRYVLDRSGLGEGDYVLEYRSEPTEVAALLAEDPSRVGLLPQPFATAALMQNGDLRIAMDMNAQWEQLQGGEGGGMVTGVTVVRREFLEEHEDVVEDFLEEHGSSVDAVNGDPEKGAAMAVRAGIVAKEAIAAEAIPRCNLVCVTGEEMKAALSAYLEALAGFDAGLIGGALPEEDFYY